MPSFRPLLLACALLLATAAPASAGDPIMPLGEVTPGMQCTALSVIQGTEISSFDARVEDIVAGDPAAEAPRILLRFSGPAIARTGVGPGFSGSPVYCGGRVIGAISEAIGEYGGMLALATPIEAILDQPVDPPVETSPRPRNARALATPISVSGLAGPVARLFSRAARRAGKVLYTAPGRPRAAAFPVQTLRPGASMSAGLSSGDVTAGAVGTVAYVDGDRVWAFGHPLEGTGRRSLFLQDAYVFAIVNNPVGVEGASTYKLAAPGHDVGILSGDGMSAVAGRLGRLPDRFPMKVIARDQDTRRQRVLNLQIADETALGLPSGTSPLALVGSGALATAATTVMGSSPSRQTGEMCVRITVRQRRKPLRFCNRYVTRGALGEGEEAMGVSGPMVTDFLEAVTAIDDFNFGTLRITGVEVNIKVRRGLKQAFLLDARGPRVVRRGRTVRLRVKVQQIRGRARWRTVSVRVPRSIPRGERVILLEGTPSDAAAGLQIDLGSLLFGGEESGGDEGAQTDDEAGPRTVAALAGVVAGIGRWDGVDVSFPSRDAAETSLEDLEEEVHGAEAAARRQRRLIRDPDVRLSGTVRVPVVVR
jgi:hypothetical protein